MQFMERLQNKHSFGLMAVSSFTTRTLLLCRLGYLPLGPPACLCPTQPPHGRCPPPCGGGASLGYSGTLWSACLPTIAPPSPPAHNTALGMQVSLGYSDTLMSASAVSTSSELTETELVAAGISAGLVRMSVGLTGGVEQRWEQLREAYLHVTGQLAAAAPGQQPLFKAAAVKRDPATGELKRTPSWHSFGSLVSDLTADGEGGTAADRSSPEAEDVAGPRVKVRRLTTNTEIHYQSLSHS